MIRNYSWCKRFGKAMDLVRDMLLSGIRPSEVAIINMLNLFADAGDIKKGRPVHTYLIKNSVKKFPSVNATTASISIPSPSIPSGRSSAASMPLPDIGRWSFYTIKHYIDQYKCDPCSDLSLRCFMGDEVDGVPGIQHLVPGFGRNTAIKLLKKHGSLEDLLSAAAVRTVGKHYAQDALIKHADYLRTNYKVLSLRRHPMKQKLNVQLFAKVTR